jgi:hypothetical protein
MRFLVLLLCSLVSAASFAQGSPSALSDFDGPVRAMVSFGREFRPEKDAEANFTDQKLAHYSLGLGYRRSLFILEKASFEESSGNASLRVDRKLENLMLWGLWQGEKWYSMSSFAGLGLGAYKEVVTTHLSGAESRTNQTRDQMLGGGAFGIAFQLPLVWISVEARMLFGDRLNPQPSLGALGRIGLWF